MLRECREHGPYRGGKCPLCGEEGRFLMNEEELESFGRVMAGILRHFPEKAGVTMDEHGWVSIYALVGAVRKRSDFRWLKPHHVKAVVETDPKGRYQIAGRKVRATYGHSIDVELDLPTEDLPDKLYYPTTEEEVDILLETGLKPVGRKKVHLSKTKEDARVAGLHRVEHPVILEINVKEARKKIVIKKAGKTVYITDEVPPEYLSKD